MKRKQLELEQQANFRLANAELTLLKRREEDKENEEEHKLALWRKKNEETQ